MNLSKFRLLTLAAGLALLAAPAANAQTTCTLPGELVVEDASNDSGAQPGVGDQDFLDFQTLHLAEPAPGKLVFTFKVGALSETPPGLRWAVQFNAPEPPPDGGEGWFVMMTTLAADDPGNIQSAPRFVYGTTGVQPPDAPTGIRLFTVAGDLAEGSGFNADGTITLVLDKSAIGNLPAGGFIENIFPIVRTITTPNGNSFDQAPGTGFYELIGDEGCSSGKSGILGAGALPMSLLLPFVLLVLPRRRREI
jgi:hypothetical protein